MPFLCFSCNNHELYQCFLREAYRNALSVLIIITRHSVTHGMDVRYVGEAPSRLQGTRDEDEGRHLRH